MLIGRRIVQDRRKRSASRNADAISRCAWVFRDRSKGRGRRRTERGWRRPPGSLSIGPSCQESAEADSLPCRCCNMSLTNDRRTTPACRPRWPVPGGHEPNAHARRQRPRRDGNALHPSHVRRGARRSPASHRSPQARAKEGRQMHSAGFGASPDDTRWSGPFTTRLEWCFPNFSGCCSSVSSAQMLCVSDQLGSRTAPL